MNFLPSFIVIPIPVNSYSKERFVKAFHDNSVLVDSSDFREGTRPETLVDMEHAVGFQYVYEYEKQVPQLDGTAIVKTFNEIPIVMADSGVLLIGASKREEEERALRFVEAHFIQRTFLERIKFEQKLLRKVADRYPELAQVDVIPGSDAGVDKLSAYGRGVKESHFWQEHGGDELLKVKLPLSDLPEPMMVGFKENGVITLYGRNLEFAQQVEVLAFVAGKLIAPYSRELPVQAKLR